jgi:hypothetical protein
MSGRIVLITLILSSLARPQSMVESAAIAAGSTAGSIAGKKLSDGITSLMNQAASQAETAAKAGKTPLLQVGPASAKQAPASTKSAPLATRPSSHYNVPPPPPLRPHRKAVQPDPEPVTPEPVEDVFQIESQTSPPPPPPRIMTAADFATVTAGMRRERVLEMGRNAVRITSTVNGQVEETYYYRDGDNHLGVVRIVDGTVARVDTQP